MFGPVFALHEAMRRFARTRCGSAIVKVLTPLFQPVSSSASNGERILVASMMFRNEPCQ